MYTFIKKDGVFYAINENRIETRLFADTFDCYGQRVGHDNAGSLLQIDTQEAADAVFKYMCVELDGVPHRPVMVGDYISASYECTGTNIWSEWYVFNQFLDHPGFDLMSTTVDCVTWFDGSNWRSIYLDGADGLVFPEEVVYDESIIRGLRAAIGCFKAQKTTKSVWGELWTGKKWRVFSPNSPEFWDFKIESI